jgi:hypothetical protein
VTGLEKSGYEPAKELALNIVKRWVKNGYIAYEDTKKETGHPIFFEKYDVDKVNICSVYFNFRYSLYLIKINTNSIY